MATSTDTAVLPDLDRARVVEAVSEAQRQADPGSFAADGRQALAQRRQEIGAHLDHLFLALRAGEPAVFVEYSRWLRDVLENRGVPSGGIVTSYELLDDYFARHHPRDSERLGRILRAGSAAVADGQPPAVARALPPADETARRFSTLISDGERQESREIYLRRFREEDSLTRANVGLLQPALYEIGRGWQANRLGVAREHIATAICRTLMAQAFGMAGFAPGNGRKAVFTTVEKARHSVGVQMVADGFEEAGWEAACLGADTPAADLVHYLDQERPELLGLSATLPVDIATAGETVARLRAELGSRCPSIMVGGLATNQLPRGWTLTGADMWAADALDAVEQGR